MKIISWNVNGIRAIAKKGFKDFVKKENPDILCIQEPKAFEEQFLKEVGELEGYKYIWHCGEKPGYAGTVIFSKVDFKESKNKFFRPNSDEEIVEFNEHGRITEMRFNDFVLLNGYFPNGGTKADGTEMLSYKLKFYDYLIEYCNDLVAKGEKVVITGDFNICHTEIDIARPKANENSIGFLPIERKKIGEFLNNGYIDVFRNKNPNLLDKYTWWSYRGGARDRNVGRRIDYFFVSKDIIGNVKNIEHLDLEMGSDHCPIVMNIDF